MSRLREGLSVLAAVLAVATVFLHTAGVWAEGVGPRYPTPEIRYDPNAGDDAEATDVPIGFTLTPAFSEGTKLSFNLAMPIESTARQENIARTIKEAYFGYKRSSPIRRFDYRFPPLARGEGNAGTKTAVRGGKITAGMDSTEIYQALWVNDSARDSLSDTQAGAPGLSETESLELEKGFKRRAARKWLGDDAYKKIQAEFGSETDKAAARDASEWQTGYLYCGGTCFAAGY